MKRAGSIRTICAFLAGILSQGCGKEPAKNDAPPATAPAPAKASSSAISVTVTVPDFAPANVQGLMLKLNGIVFRGRQHTGLRLFLNNPSADAETPLSDPSYLGSISPGHFDKDETASGDFVLDLTTLKAPAMETLKTAIKEKKMVVSAVPVLRKGAGQAPPAVTIREVKLHRKENG